MLGKLYRGEGTPYNQNQIKYVFAPKLFCEESQRNIAETRLHPIQGTMKLRAAIPLSNGSIAVRDTSCICRQCYNDGVAYFASCSGWVKHTLTKAMLNRPTEPESWRLVEMWLRISSATIFTTEVTKSKTKRLRKPMSKKCKSVQCSSWYCFLCSERSPVKFVRAHAHAPELIRRPAHAFVSSVSREPTQLCNLRYVHVFIRLY